jgi:hypothetical protein
MISHSLDDISMTAEARRAVVLIAIIFMTVAAAAFVMVRKRWHAPATPTIRNIAVLPFKPVLTTQRMPVIEQQMLLAIIATVEASGDLMVTSANRADAVLSGTIDTSEGRIRIDARLWRVSDSRDIWQGRFDRPQEDVVALQRSIADQVVEAARM